MNKPISKCSSLPSPILCLMKPSRELQLPLNVLVNFPQIMMLWSPHDTRFSFIFPNTLPLLQTAYRVWAFTLLFLIPTTFFFDFFSRFWSRLLRLFGWVLTRVCHSLPGAGANTVLSNLHIPRAFGVTLFSWVEATRHRSITWHHWNRSWFSHCLLFDMAICMACFRFEGRKWLQENIDKFLIFNKWRRWFHSSLLKLLLVNMSGVWFSASTYLIWILGFMLILSDNQSNATLSVLDTWHVSLAGFFLWLSSQDCFIVFKNVEIRLEINVPSQKHDSTVKTVGHLGVPSGWIAWAFSCLISVSRYGFSGCLLRCSVNTTLLSPHPKNREQVNHPVAIQRPMK